MFPSDDDHIRMLLYFPVACVDSVEFYEKKDILEGVFMVKRSVFPSGKDFFNVFLEFFRYDNEVTFQCNK